MGYLLLKMLNEIHFSIAFLLGLEQVQRWVSVFSCLTKLEKQMQKQRLSY